MKAISHYFFLSFVLGATSLYALDKPKKIDLACTYKRDIYERKLNLKKNDAVISKKSHLNLNPHTNNSKKDNVYSPFYSHPDPFHIKRGERTVGEYWEKSANMILLKNKMKGN